MASESWPGSLPERPLSEGFKKQKKPQFIRTDMDRGPAKVRRRSTFEPEIYLMSFLMTTAQLATFETWFDTNLLGGTARFDFTHPLDATTYEWRFMETYQVSDKKAGNFEVQMRWEKLT